MRPEERPLPTLLHNGPQKQRKRAPLTRYTPKLYSPRHFCARPANLGEPSKTSLDAAINASINFKALERKNELERQKLIQIMKKLEIDLMNAKIDLRSIWRSLWNSDGDDNLRSTPINVAYACLNSNFESKPQKLPLQQQQPRRTLT